MKLVRRFIAAFTLALCTSFSVAAHAQSAVRPAVPPGNYVLEKTHASLLWRVSHMGMSQYTARFKSFDARLQFDPGDMTKSVVEVTVDLRSVETDFVPTDGRDFNAELRSEPFFNAARFPTATFKSKSVQLVGANRMKVRGDLMFLGLAQQIELDVVLNGAVAEHPFVKVPWLGFSAKGRVPRKAFGLNPLPQTTGIGDEVEIVVEAEFIRLK